jgi:autotransporter-associated beta strand protein
MKPRNSKYGTWLFCGALILVLGTYSTAAQLPAFPGAEGFGKFATGGRGGSVYYVTTTNDSGPGSFRAAVSQPNRTVVFAVSGVIDYQPPRYNVRNNVTIAGQTAPGTGVALYGDGIGYTDANHTITRFIRFRMGKTGVGEDTVTVARGHNMIFDHISATWSLDEVFSVSGNPDPTNITIQASIIGQGLQNHSAGGLIQTDGGVSIVRSLYIDNATRNPKVKGVNEFVNNVVYNWETDAYILGDSAGPSYANIIGNYFINGPGSGNRGAFSRGNANFNLFATDNWQDKNRNGTLDGVLLTQPDYDDNTWHVTPFPWPIAVEAALPARTAVKVVVSEVGPSWKRDAVDERLITELTSWGTLGQTIFTEFDPPMNGPGLFKGGPVPLDTDLDGMPDYWEAGLGLPINAPNNNDPSPSSSGYTRLEDYLHWLAAPHGVALTNTIVEIDLRQFTRGFTNFAPVYAVGGVSNGTVTLVNNFTARFVPATDFIGLAGFGFSVTDSQGSSLARPMGLFFTPQPPAFGRVWRGDDTLNNWSVAGAANWFDDQALLFPFANGASVEFDDTGSGSPAVNLIGPLQPALITVQAAKHYTFSGPGELIGAMALNKSGPGSLTLENTNHFTGATTVSNGTLRVNGHLSASPITLRSGTTLAGQGQIGVPPVINSGASLAPGFGIGHAGKLTFANGLNLTGGIALKFDLTDDPAGFTETNDQIAVTGDLHLSGVNSIQVNLLNGPLANGIYTLITYSGDLSGSLANLSLLGANGVLTNLPGVIAIHVDNNRPPASLVWSGTGPNHLWDSGTNANWLNDALPDWFYFGDTVRFDDTGLAAPVVAIPGPVSPAAVVVAATQDYTFSGTGKISGTTGLLKTNSGALLIVTTNDYTGATIISGGALVVSQLANGGAASGLGGAASHSSNLVFSTGGTLRYVGGPASTDRGATFNSGGGTIDLTSGETVLTWNGILAGPGALTKTGPGRLDLNAISTYTGGTIVNAGDVRLVNVSGFGSGPVTLNGTPATSATLRFAADTQTLGNKLTVLGTNNFILLRGNNTLSQLDGDGTLIGGLVDSGSTLTFAGNMMAFSGTFKAGTVLNPRFNGSTGSASATFDLGTGSAKLNNRNGGLTAQLGALLGGPNTILEGASSANNATTYVIGGKNLDTTFAGKIQEVIPARSVAISKVGTGTLTLTGANTYNGPTTINAGTLLVNNLSGHGTGSNTVTVANGGTLGGTGFIRGAVVVNSGGTIAPGAGIGTLTIRSNLTLNSGAILRFELGAIAASDRLIVSNALTLNGTLHLAAAAGFGPGTYPLVHYGGTLSGTLPTIGSKPAGYSFDLNTSTPGQVRLIVTTQAPPVIHQIISDGANFIFSGTGPTNATYHVLTATNVALPLTGWTPIATNQFSAAGTFNLTNAINPATPQLFYRLQLP